MPARVILVHDQPVFLQRASRALQDAGYDVAAFANSLDAWPEIAEGAAADVLVTMIRFAEGLPNGVALARRARLAREMKVVFIGTKDMACHADDLGPVLESPVTPEALVSAVAKALNRIAGERNVPTPGPGSAP